MSTKSRKPRKVYVKLNGFFRFVKCKKKESCGYVIGNEITCDAETLILKASNHNHLNVRK